MRGLFSWGGCTLRDRHDLKVQIGIKLLKLVYFDEYCNKLENSTTKLGINNPAKTFITVKQSSNVKITSYLAAWLREIRLLERKIVT